jgi:putative DNA primase/helicase
MNNQMRNAALKYAERGFPVFPLHYPSEKGCSCEKKTECDRIGKHPRIKGWNNAATTKPEKIKKWWTETPDANIGIITGTRSSLLIVDVDIKSNTHEPLHKLKANYPAVDKTATVKSGGGGFHFYFKSDDPDLKNSVGMLAENVDIRANGGYIIAPPSLHRSGKRYEWSSKLDNIQHAPTKLIQDLVNLKADVKKNKQQKSSIKNKGATIKSGSRNEELTSIAGKLRSEGKEYDEILKNIDEINSTKCLPPLEFSEVEGICKSVMRYKPHDIDSEIKEKLNSTDYVIAEILYERNKSELLFDVERSVYLIYTGSYWLVDYNNHYLEGRIGQLQSYFKEQATSENDSAEKKRLIACAKRCSNITSIRSIASILHIAVQSIRIETNSLDANGDLLNFPNGTLELSTQRLRQHNPEDRITSVMSYNYDPEAKCPTWINFLNTMFEGDEEIIQFIKKALGYTLSNDQSLQCFFFLYGVGKNGKSTLLETVRKLIGKYSVKAPVSCITYKKYGDGIPNDVARFAGKRLVLFSEIAQGLKLDEAKMKDFTGGDTITARFLRQEYFDFSPTHTIWMYGNYRPIIVGTDEGIWRRIMLIHCPHIVSEDEHIPDLDEKLTNELPGILNWCLAGYKSYLQNGKKITEPESVRNARLEYRSESDITSQFLNDKCVLSFSKTIRYSYLYNEYTQWCKDMNRPPLSSRKLSAYLKSNNFKDYNSGGYLHFEGIGLPDQSQNGSPSSRSS